MQSIEFTTPLRTSNPDFTGTGWSAFGPGVFDDAGDASGYRTTNLAGAAALALGIYQDDGRIPGLATIVDLTARFRLGQSDTALQGGLPVLPYIRYADGPAVYAEVVTAPYATGFANYTARFPRDPNGLPWTRASIYTLRGQQLLVGLRSAPSDLLSGQISWSAYGLGVDFLLPVPRVFTDPASLIADTRAQLNGRVNPESANGTYPVSYWFEYGTTTAYGTMTTPVAGLTGSTELGVSSTITGLTASTGYHFRLAAQTADGIVYGDDKYFSSAATGVGRWRLDEFKRVPTGGFAAGDRTRETSEGFDIPSTSTDDSTCPFLEFP